MATSCKQALACNRTNQSPPPFGEDDDDWRFGSRAFQKKSADSPVRVSALTIVKTHYRLIRRGIGNLHGLQNGADRDDARVERVPPVSMDSQPFPSVGKLDAVKRQVSPELWAMTWAWVVTWAFCCAAGAVDNADGMITVRRDFKGLHPLHFVFGIKSPWSKKCKVEWCT
jgi:hypothetical protein